MKFSIITINYNNCEGLRRTLESVVSQTFRDFEYIVIDGGSTDGSKELIEQYADRIDYWVSEPDKGIYNAMNKGIAVAKGVYCNFMNSGDSFVDSSVLDKLVKERLVSDIIVGRSRGVKVTGDRIDFVYVSNPPQNITAKYLFDHSLNHQACFIRTCLLKKNNYREDLKIVSDWAFFFDELILRDATYQCLDCIVCNYDTEGVSSNVDLEEERKLYFYTAFSKRMADFFYDRDELHEILYRWTPQCRHYKFITWMCLMINRLWKVKKKCRLG